MSPLAQKSINRPTTTHFKRTTKTVGQQMGQGHRWQEKARMEVNLVEGWAKTTPQTDRVYQECNDASHTSGNNPKEEITQTPRRRTSRTDSRKCHMQENDQSRPNDKQTKNCQARHSLSKTTIKDSKISTGDNHAIAHQSQQTGQL